MNSHYLRRVIQDSDLVWNLDELHEGVDYLAEGGILKRLLLESLQPIEELQLFYVLAYIWSVYKATYPDGPADMSDDNYVLFSKVEGELSQLVPSIMTMLKDTYEAWIVNEIMWYGGEIIEFLFTKETTKTQLFAYPLWEYNTTHLPIPINDIYLVWSKSTVDIGKEKQWEDVDWLIRVRNQKLIITRKTKPRKGYQIEEWGELEWRFYSWEHAVFPWADAPERLYALPTNRGATIPKKHFKPQDFNALERYRDIGKFELLYGKITMSSIFKFSPTVQLLHRCSEGTTSRVTTKKILVAYHRYLKRPNPSWQYNIATISILLNIAHNNGSMAEDIGSKYTTTKKHGIDQRYLDALTNLHDVVPEGTDHKTLRFIYNNWRRFPS